MKVFIPVIDSARNRYKIANSFIESSSICIFNSKDNQVTWYESKGMFSSYDEILEEFKNDGVAKAIVSSVQPETLTAFKSKGFNIYKSVGSDLRLNLELLKIRCLPILETDEAFNEITAFYSDFATSEPSFCNN